jgi:hypothetical protein
VTQIPEEYEPTEDVLQYYKVKSCWAQLKNFKRTVLETIPEVVSQPKQLGRNNRAAQLRIAKIKAAKQAEEKKNNFEKLKKAAKKITKPTEPVALVDGKPLLSQGKLNRAAQLRLAQMQAKVKAAKKAAAQKVVAPRRMNATRSRSVAQRTRQGIDSYLNRMSTARQGSIQNPKTASISSKSTKKPTKSVNLEKKARQQMEAHLSRMSTIRQPSKDKIASKKASSARPTKSVDPLALEEKRLRQIEAHLNRMSSVRQSSKAPSKSNRPSKSVDPLAMEERRRRQLEAHLNRMSSVNQNGRKSLKISKETSVSRPRKSVDPLAVEERRRRQLEAHLSRMVSVRQTTRKTQIVPKGTSAARESKPVDPLAMEERRRRQMESHLSRMSSIRHNNQVQKAAKASSTRPSKSIDPQAVEERRRRQLEAHLNRMSTVRQNKLPGSNVPGKAVSRTAPRPAHPRAKSFKPFNLTAFIEQKKHQRASVPSKSLPQPKSTRRPTVSMSNIEHNVTAAGMALRERLRDGANKRVTKTRSALAFVPKLNLKGTGKTFKDVDLKRLMAKTESLNQPAMKTYDFCRSLRKSGSKKTPKKSKMSRVLETIEEHPSEPKSIRGRGQTATAVQVKAPTPEQLELDNWAQQEAKELAEFEDLEDWCLEQVKKEELSRNKKEMPVENIVEHADPVALDHLCKHRKVDSFSMKEIIKVMEDIMNAIAPMAQTRLGLNNATASEIQEAEKCYIEFMANVDNVIARARSVNVTSCETHTEACEAVKISCPNCVVISNANVKNSELRMLLDRAHQLIAQLRGKIDAEYQAKLERLTGIDTFTSYIPHSSVSDLLGDDTSDDGYLEDDVFVGMEDDSHSQSSLEFEEEFEMDKGHHFYKRSVSEDITGRVVKAIGMATIAAAYQSGMPIRA